VPGGPVPGGEEEEKAVAAVSAITELEVLDLLTRLVEKSLVVYEEDGQGRSRYRLLETVRQYARAGG
jgi:predicted ATPase